MVGMRNVVGMQPSQPVPPRHQKTGSEKFMIGGINVIIVLILLPFVLAIVCCVLSMIFGGIGMISDGTLQY